MPKHIFSLCLLTTLVATALTGCGQKANAPQSAAQTAAGDSGAAGDSAYQKIADGYIAKFLAFNPGYATALGIHDNDGKIYDYTRAGFEAEYAFDKETLAALTSMDTAKLSAAMRYDYQVLRNAVQSSVYRFEDFQAYRKNPMGYAGALDVNIYIKRDFAPLETRVRYITSILNEAPKVFAAAKANLDDTLAKPFVETAIQIAEGSAAFLGKDLVAALKDVKNDTLMTAFKAASSTAIREIKDFAAYLKKEKLPKATANYAAGKEKYQRMLEGEFITLSPEKILELGLAELKKEQDVFAATARKIDSTKKPIDVFKAIQKDHPTAEGLIPDTKKNLEAIRQFLVDKKIITLPSEVRVRVEETPQYARATSFASMDTPGPFEMKATEAYYYVTPTEKEWTAKRKDEWLTAFNFYTTDVVSIHEAYPGHYVQFLHLNASPATKVQKIFGSYAFIEGWAHYTEKMLLDEGFGYNSLVDSSNHTDTLTALKYRLAQSDEALLRLCRLCVSVKTHCEGMSLDDAIKFFVDNCYYEGAPARQEAVRGTFDPGYLYYTLGKLQILKLREDFKTQEGSNYSLQKFHDAMLKSGMPPIRLLRGMMLKDNAIANDIL
ncbi:MAG: DUF885 domain-containing protein [Rhizobacter sp.]|nr:DUF885 domain-containing protein [Chlorobiales bacterium]